MQRHEILNSLKQLKLFGMAATYDEVVVQGIRRNHTVDEILANLGRRG